MLVKRYLMDRIEFLFLPDVRPSNLGENLSDTEYQLVCTVMFLCIACTSFYFKYFTLLKVLKVCVYILN